MATTKEIRKELCSNYCGAETLTHGEKTERIKWVIYTFECSYSTAYYLVNEARTMPYIFELKGNK